MSKTEAGNLMAAEATHKEPICCLLAFFFRFSFSTGEFEEYSVPDGQPDGQARKVDQKERKEERKAQLSTAQSP
jgi:hypothetical protein